MIKVFTLLSVFVIFAGCASYTEQTSPCVCDWEKLNHGDDGELVA